MTSIAPRRWLGWALLGSAGLLVACANGFDNDGRGGGYRPEPLNQAQKVEMKNRELEQRVMAAMQADPRVKIMNLAVQAVDGAVQISGIPQTLQSRDQAIWIAERVRGVRAVVSNMTFN